MSGAGALHEVTLSSELSAYFSGEPKDAGSLPTLVYFGASGIESLSLRPFCTPIDTFVTSGVRALSFDLPYHFEGAEKTGAIKKWVEEIKDGRDIITPFVDSIEEALRELEDLGWITISNLGFGGLSRGGLIAGHLAARFPNARAIIGFAPVTRLTGSISFTEVADTPLAKSLNLDNVASELTKIPTRIYIGNNDTMVGTRNAFEFTETLVNTATDEGIRSPKVELILSPSIGHKGHGTAPKIFEEGAAWALGKLL